MNASFSHLLIERRKVGETLFIYSKVLIPLHIVDVKVDTVERNAEFSVTAHDFPHLILIHIAPAALAVTERPQRRNIASADQTAELADNVTAVLARDKIHF